MSLYLYTSLYTFLYVLQFALIPPLKNVGFPAHFVKEETGLDVEIIEIESEQKVKTEGSFEKTLPFSIMYEYVDYKTGMHEHFDMIYLVKPKNNTEINADYKEVTEIKWFSEEEIDKLEMYENTKISLHKAFTIIKNM